MNDPVGEFRISGCVFPKWRIDHPSVIASSLATLFGTMRHQVLLTHGIERDGQLAYKWNLAVRSDHIRPYDVMNNGLRGLLAGAGAMKWGGGCLGTVLVFALIWMLLGQCN